MKKPLQESIQQTVQKAWADAISSIMGLEEEMARRFQQVRERADLPKGSEELQRMMADLGRRLQGNSELLEQRLQESVRGVIKKVRTPLVEELAVLKERAEQVGRRIERQLHLQKKAEDGAGEGTESQPETSAGGEGGAENQR